MKLSIIICVRNTERGLLEKCLESIGRATVGMSDCEIIMVDDGSENSYGDIATAFGARYEKQQSAGTLAARLHGITLAHGEYIAFADSDDTVSFNYYPPMIKRADEGFDIVFGPWAFHTRNTRYVCSGDDSVSGDILSDEPLPLFLIREGRQHSYYVLWNKIYRSSILKAAAAKLSAIDAPHPFCFSEDALINLFAFSTAKKVAAVGYGYYFYRIHGEQTVNVTSKKKLLYQATCMSYTLEKCRETVTGRRGEKTLLERTESWSGLMARTHFAYAKRGGYTDVFPLLKEKYRVRTLDMPSRRDSAVYDRVRLLPDSAEKIDTALLSLCEQGGIVRLKKPKRGGYAELLLRGLLYVGWKIEFCKRYPALPPERISPFKRILFNAAVRRIGSALFGKGSRIRAFLKRFI